MSDGIRTMDGQDQNQNHNLGCHDKTSASNKSSDICEVSEQPLKSLKLASHTVLEEAQQRGRLKCSKCGGSRKFFCYTCCSLVGVTQEQVPIIKVGMKSVIIVKVRLCWWYVDLLKSEFKLCCVSCCTQLPVKIDIIKHPNETDGKSTAIHAKILAPNDVTIYTYPCIPDFEKDKVCFPKCHCFSDLVLSHCVTLCIH